MKKLYFFIFLSLHTILIHSQYKYPEIEFKYNWKSTCIDIVGYLFYGFEKIGNTKKEEFAKIFPRLLSYWNSQAPVLFEEVFCNFNCGFNEEKRVALISLGKYFGYGSNNFLILGLNNQLDNNFLNEFISREDVFVELVFHELLHIWIDNNVDISKSKILSKYNNENSLVRSHIHLMAIQKMVYKNLNRNDIINQLYFSAPYEYQRAWDIVNKIEDYENILQDIKYSLKSRK